MGTHLRLYGSDKTALGLLPEHTGLVTQLSLNSPGTLVCDYPLLGKNAALLEQDVAYLAVIVDGVESPDWFLLDEDGDDKASDAGDARPLRLSARGLLALLEWAQVYPKAHTPGADPNGMDPKHDFTASTPGLILKTLIDRAKARGCFPDLTYSFTATHDSNGVAWPKGYDVTYAAGTNYLTIVGAMADNGWADVRMSGFVLDLFVPETEMGEDRTSSVLLRLGQQVLEAPRKRSRRGIISHLLGIGDGKNMVEVSNAATETKYGRREGNAADGRMTTNGSLTDLATETLSQHLEAKEGFTLQLSLDAPPGEVWPVPGVDYGVGHKIAYDQRRNPDGSFEALRVRTLTWGWGSAVEAPTVSVELNDLFVETAIRLQRRVTGIVNGSVIDAPPPVDTPVSKDTTIPKPPGVPAIETFKYPVGDQFYAGANVAWTPTDRNTDESDYLDHQQYLVQYRFGPTDPWIAAAPVTEAAWSIDGLIPGRSISVQVAAQDSSGHVSTWAISGFVELEADIDPPAAPSQLTATTRLGTVTLTWDGLDLVGAPMAADYTYSEVYRSTDPGVVAPAGELVDRFDGRGGSTVAGGLDYGVEQFFTMVAYDTSGNMSAPSAAVSATTQPLVSVDVTSGAIDDLALADGAVTEPKVAFGAVTAEKLTIGSIGDSVVNNGSFEDVSTADATLPAMWRRSPLSAGSPGNIGLDATSPISGARSVALAVTDPGVTQTRWNLFTNPAFRDPGANVEVRRNLCINPSFGTNTTGWNPARGTFARATGTGAQGPGYIIYTSNDGTAVGGNYVTYGSAAVAPGDVLTVSAYVLPDAAANYRARIWWFTAADVLISVSEGPITSAATVGGWTRLYATGTAPATAAKATLVVRAEPALAVGQKFRVDGALMEKAAVLLPYIDGDTSPGPGLVASWTGTAHASASIATGVLPFGTVDNQGAYMIDGGVMCPGMLNVADSRLSLGDDVGGMRTGMLAGKTYTISAEGFASAADAAEHATRARRIVVFTKSPTVNGGAYVETLSPPVPVGTTPTRVSVTVAVPADATEAFIRLYNGSANGIRSVTWAKAMVEQTATVAPYFDGTQGDAPEAGWTYSWDGAPDESSSTAVFNNQGAALESQDFPVTPGDLFALRATAKSADAAAQVFRLGLIGGADPGEDIGGIVWAAPNDFTLGPAPAVASGAVRVPAGWSYARMIVMNNAAVATTDSTVLVDSCSAQRVIVSAQIGEGQIKSPNIEAEAIKALHIAADAITADMVNAGTLHAEITVSGRIATALTGARVQLDSSGLKAYNAAGAVTVSIDTSGSALITGTYQTAPSGRRLEISTAALNNSFGEDGQHSLKWTPTTLSAGWSQAGIMPVVDTSVSGKSGLALWLQSSGQSAAPFGGSTIFLGMTSASINLTSQANKNASLSVSSNAAGDTSADISAMSTSIGQGGTGTVQINGGTSITLFSSNGSIFLNAPGGNMYLYERDMATEALAVRNDGNAYIRSQTAYIRTSTAAVNMTISSFGTIARSTSLESYKVAIDREWADKVSLAAVKGLTPASYYDRLQAERFASWVDPGSEVPDENVELPRLNLGLIAEDVEALGLLGLTNYDAEGNLTGVAYERVAVALIPWLRDLDARLAAVEAATQGSGA